MLVNWREGVKHFDLSNQIGEFETYYADLIGQKFSIENDNRKWILKRFHVVLAKDRDGRDRRKVYCHFQSTKGGHEKEILCFNVFRARGLEMPKVCRGSENNRPLQGKYYSMVKCKIAQQTSGLRKVYLNSRLVLVLFHTSVKKWSISEFTWANSSSRSRLRWFVSSTIGQLKSTSYSSSIPKIICVSVG